MKNEEDLRAETQHLTGKKKAKEYKVSLANFLFPARTCDLVVRSEKFLKRGNRLSKKTSASLAQFNKETSKKLGFGWLTSLFIPGTAAFNARRDLAIQIAKEKDTYTIDGRNKPNFLEKLLIFPSWKKTLFLALFTVVMVAIALTGVGALAQLGVLGTFGVAMTGFIAVKLALPLLSLVIAKLAASVTLAAVTTAVGGFLASLAMREWLRPGSTLLFLPFNSLVIDNKKYSLRKIARRSFIKPQEDVESVVGRRIRFAMNPARWLEGVLNFLNEVILRALEIGTKKDSDSSPLRFVVKGLVYFAFQVALTPTEVLVAILDIPFNVLRSINNGVSSFFAPESSKNSDKVIDDKSEGSSNKSDDETVNNETQGQPPAPAPAPANDELSDAPKASEEDVESSGDETVNNETQGQPPAPAPANDELSDAPKASEKNVESSDNETVNNETQDQPLAPANDEVSNPVTESPQTHYVGPTSISNTIGKRGSFEQTSVPGDDLQQPEVEADNLQTTFGPQ